MPFDHPPAPPAEVRECGDASGGLYNRLQQSTATSPALAFACAHLLSTEAQRDRIQRDAFISAVSTGPQVARQQVAGLLDRPWVTDPGFFPLMKFAVSMADSDPQTARKLLLLAAERYPSPALREVTAYSSLPFSQDIFEQAARAAPDEAAGVGSGPSDTAKIVLERLRASRAKDIQVLARLAQDPSLSESVRPRTAVFFRQLATGEMSMSQVLHAADSGNFFSAVARLRMNAARADAALYDRVLENYAEVLFRTAQDAAGKALSSDLAQLPARDLYLLLTYGRSEEDDLLFGIVFDRLLLPKLRSYGPEKLLNEVRDLNLRRFYSTAAAHHRLDAFLATSPSKASQSDLLARSMKAIGNAETPVDEAVAAAEIVDAVQDAGRLAQLDQVVSAEYQTAGPVRPLYGLIAACILRRMAAANLTPSPELSAAAAVFLPFFHEPHLLDATSLFNAEGISIQQQFFYDDDDGADSFMSFRKYYLNDPAWKWEDRGWYVHVTASGEAGRRIEVYANVPTTISGDATGDRRHALAKMMADQGLIPTVVIHRGHTWYVEQSLRYVTPSARLVYLGSCHGLTNVYHVLALANRAQMIATRGIGTEHINDPLLKDLNDELLRGGKSVDWDQFWQMQEKKLGRSSVFSDYIPPPQNAAAIMLAAYYEYLASGRSL